VGKAIFILRHKCHCGIFRRQHDGADYCHGAGDGGWGKSHAVKDIPFYALLQELDAGYIWRLCNIGGLRGVICRPLVHNHMDSLPEKDFHKNLTKDIRPTSVGQR